MANKNNITIVEENQSRIPDSGIPPGNQGQGRGEFGTGTGDAGGNVDYELLAEQQLEGQLEIIRQSLQSLPIFEESKIKLDRKIYSKKKFNEAVNNEFEELFREEDTFTVEQFFKLYDKLFFDIPRFGVDSHDELRDRSNEFLSGFTTENNNTLIDQLNAKILELEEQLLLASQVVPEHPLYKNNTLVSVENSWEVYLMDKGFKRLLNTSEDPWWKNVIKVLGYVDENGNPDGYKIPKTSYSELDLIPSGPNYSPTNSGRSTAIYQGQLKFADEIQDIPDSAQQVISLQSQVQQLQSQVISANERIKIAEESSNNINQYVSTVLSEIDVPVIGPITNLTTVQNFLNNLNSIAKLTILTKIQEEIGGN